MKNKPIFILFSILLSASFFGQDSLKIKQERHLSLGVDILNAGLSFFSDQKVYQAFASYNINKKIHIVADGGFGKNKYEKNGYDAEASGIFVKAGAVYMLINDPKNEYDGFYAGPKLGASFYKQRYDKVPVRGFDAGDYFVTLPESNQTSLWLEASLGGRVQLFKSNFFVDVQLQPRYLLYSTKQDDVKPMIVPGFGKSSTGFNFGFAWNIAYRF